MLEGSTEFGRAIVSFAGPLADRSEYTPTRPASLNPTRRIFLDHSSFCPSVLRIESRNDRFALNKAVETADGLIWRAAAIS